jgi:hypothetical protein
MVRVTAVGPAAYAEATIRSLDAIHLATAQLLAAQAGGAFEAFVTYDNRVAGAASAIGLPTASPGARLSGYQGPRKVPLSAASRLAVSGGGCTGEVVECLGWILPAQGLAGAAVEPAGDRVEAVSGVGAEVGAAAGEVLA